MDPDTITAWTAVVAAVIALVALAVAAVAARHAGRSASAADGSAQSAKKITEIEEDRRHSEREREHELLGPENYDRLIVVREKGGAAGEGLFATITTTRDYRVRWQPRTGTTGGPTYGALLRANQPHRFYIEDWRPEEIHFRFWPPVAGVDDTDPWACPCDRPTGESGDGPGHWNRRVPVVYGASPAGPKAAWV